MNVIDRAELSSGTERLAVALSVATLIEPELIRAVRLDILPGLDVGAESELWFSDWVSRGREAISLRADLLPGLRGRLSEQLASAGPDDRLHRLGDIVADLHTGMSSALRVEEEVTWLAVARPPHHREAIDEALQAALRALVDEGRTGIVDWYAGAGIRLPAEARATRSGWLLATVTARRYPEAVPAGPAPDDLVTLDIAPICGHVDETRLGLSWAGDDLVISGDVARGEVAIPVSATEPRLVDVLADDERTLRIPADGEARVRVPGRRLRLRTARGDLFEIRGSAHFALVRGLAERVGPVVYGEIEDVLPALEILDALVEAAGRHAVEAPGERTAVPFRYEVRLPSPTWARLGAATTIVTRWLGDAFHDACDERGWTLLAGRPDLALTRDGNLAPGTFRVVTDPGPVPPDAARSGDDETAGLGPGESTAALHPAGDTGSETPPDELIVEQFANWLRLAAVSDDRFDGTVNPTSMLKLLLWEADQNHIIVAGDSVRITLPDVYRVRLAPDDRYRIQGAVTLLSRGLADALESYADARGWVFSHGRRPTVTLVSTGGIQPGTVTVESGFSADEPRPGTAPPETGPAAGPHLRSDDGTAYALPPGRVVIGNQAPAEILLPDVWIAASHAAVTRDGDRIRISRLSTSNGFLVNGRAVDTAELEDGDEIALGGTRLVLHRFPAEEPAEQSRTFADDPTVELRRSADDPAAYPLPARPAAGPPGEAFRRRALRRGYHVGEVDTFLRRVEQTIDNELVGAEAITAQQVHDWVFRVRFGGYDEWQVDLHLDRIERYLAAREQG